MKEGLRQSITDVIGNKIKSVDDVKMNAIIEALNILKIGEFNSVGKFILKDKISEITPKSIFENYIHNKLFFQSNSDYTLMKNIENECLDIFGEKYDFIELSPIVPIGLNSVLGNIDTNKSIITLNNAEVLSEVTLPLTLASLKTMKEEKLNPNDFEVHLGTVERLIRNQKFDKDFYLPHFKIFGGVSVFKKNNIRREIQKNIKEVIDGSLSLLLSLKEKGLNLSDIEIEFGNSELLYDLLQDKLGIEKGKIIEDIHNFRKEYGNQNILSHFGVNVSEKIGSINDEKDFFETNNIMKYYNIFKDIEDTIIKEIKEKYPDVKYYFNPGRLGGVGHYNGTMFTIFAKNDEQEKIDIIDGGLTDRGSKLIGDNKIKTLVFAAGLELLGKNFTS